MANPFRRMYENRIIRGGERQVGGPNLGYGSDPESVHRWHVAIVADAERSARSQGLQARSHEQQVAKVEQLDEAWRQQHAPYVVERTDRRQGDRRQSDRRGQ